MRFLSLRSIELNNEIYPYNEDGLDRIRLWKPYDTNVFSLFISLKIGFIGEVGADLFNILVLSRKYYEDLPPHEARDIRRKWKYFIVESYDWSAIWVELLKRLEVSDKENWPDCLSALRREFSWEFENLNKPPPPEVH